MNQLLKKVIFIFPLVFIFMTSCKEESSNCNIDNPLETIEWLKQTKVAFEISARPTGSKIIQYEYQGECVFWIDDCYQCPDGLIIVYNASQEIICQFGSIAGLNTCPDFANEATNEEVLWGE